MNDPNGMFYKDGEWHLFFQHNPYGSQWENMNWGHSVSTDLIHWIQLPEAIEPDGLGTIFSGSCVVDSANTAGFGKGAVIAFYTSNGENQVQSMAYSTDNGRTFTKYPGNPIITSDVPDFRDPHVFWNQEAGIWNMILAAGQEMRIYSSKNLKDWMYESSFGQGYGSHAGVWECPDLMELPVRGTNKHKWMLICNINPGGPSGGSATQYFVGQFDGHKFTCESKPEVTKWLDYGKDHYATVTFSNAPDGRHVAMAWMSNWQYGNQVPTKQYRSANSIPCDLGLYEYDGETYASVTPSRELFNLRGKVISRPSSSCEILATLKGSCTFTLDNDKGEYVRLAYDAKAKTFSMDRRKSGDTSFSELFPVKTTAPVNGKINRLRVFIDHSSVEAFDADGKMSMTNLVFPSVPYNKLSVKGKVKITIYSLNK
jgi:levanase/fructan beta-fructosidase